MPRCHVALGGNVGPVSEAFDRALDLLDQARCAVGAVSSYFRTAPIGDQAGGDFLNAAVEIETRLPPLELLDTLQAIESSLGRMHGSHWGPRTLDLDLVFYGRETLSTPRLTVPHPACWYRRFVLDPLAEIAADFVHPIKKVTVKSLRDRLLAGPLTVALAGATPARRSRLLESLRGEFPAVEWFHWPRSPGTDQPSIAAPTFLVWLGVEAADGRAASDPAGSDFDSLPLLPRIDASSREPGEFLRHVLHSALGR